MTTDSYADGLPMFKDGREPLLREVGRIRSAFFLGINFVAYAVANAFSHYLSSGQWVSGSFEEYGRTLGRPLGEAIVSPLNVFSHPWLLAVLGLLWAALIIVPLLVACLYRTRYCLLFLLCVAILGQALVLTLFLAAGCMLVAATQWRSRSPMLAILLGLMPIFVYLYFSGSRSAVITQPLQRLVLYVPFVIAAVGAVIAGAVVLIVAKLMHYRPGVIWPVLAAFLVVPAWLFYSRIGPDELAYAVLARELTPSESLMADQPLQGWPSIGGNGKSDLLEQVQMDIELRRRQWVERCTSFCLWYPSSDRLSAVIWIQGLAIDTKISVPALQAGLVQYYDSHPSEESRGVWQTLAQRFPSDRRSGVAQWRLAVLAARAGQVELARQLLDRAEALLTGPGNMASGQRAGIFARDEGVPSDRYLQNVAEQVRWLKWMMDFNRVSEMDESADALAKFLSLDHLAQGRREYGEKLLALGEKYMHTSLADNFALAAALNKEDPLDRAYALMDLQDVPNSDAAIQANYELGRLAMQARRNPRLAELLGRPNVYLERVASEVNPWQHKAEQQLQTLQAREPQGP